MAERKETDPEAPITIKKYANRRLYNTATSSYVTLEHLAQMVKDGVDFQVFDAKSGDDITRSVLTQIIFEAEGKGQNLLPISFLRRLIKFYGDSLQSVVPSYLDMSMESFTRNQDEMRTNLQEAFGQPIKQFEEINRRNMEAFQQAVSLFNPLAVMAERPAPKSTQEDKPRQSDPEEKPGGGDEIDELRTQLDDMRRQLNTLLKDRS